MPDLLQYPVPRINERIENISRNFGIDPKLVTAIVGIESSFDPRISKFEPGVKPERAALFTGFLHVDQETEENGQRVSYGLMQILGLTARNLGFSKHFIELYEPDTNLFWGCKLLQQLTRRFEEEDEVIAAYNDGNARRTQDGTFVVQGYVDKVKNYRRKMKIPINDIGGHSV